MITIQSSGAQRLFDHPVLKTTVFRWYFVSCISGYLKPRPSKKLMGAENSDCEMSAFVYLWTETLTEVYVICTVGCELFMVKVK